MKPLLRFVFYTVVLTLSCDAQVGASPWQPPADWLPVDVAVADDEVEVVAAPNAVESCKSLFRSPLRQQLLREISGEETSRLTYIYRLWGYGLGSPKVSVSLLEPKIMPTWLDENETAAIVTLPDRSTTAVALLDLAPRTSIVFPADAPASEPGENTTTGNSVPEPGAGTLLTITLATAGLMHRAGRRSLGRLSR